MRVSRHGSKRRERGPEREVLVFRETTAFGRRQGVYGSTPVPSGMTP